jgi:hypothetical protein
MGILESEEERRNRLLRETRDASERQANATEQLVEQGRQALSQAESERRHRQFHERMEDDRCEYEAKRPEYETRARRELREFMTALQLADPFAVAPEQLSLTQRDELAAWQNLAVAFCSAKAWAGKIPESPHAKIEAKFLFEKIEALKAAGREALQGNEDAQRTLRAALEQLAPAFEAAKASLTRAATEEQAAEDATRRAESVRKQKIRKQRWIGVSIAVVFAVLYFAFDVGGLWSLIPVIGGLYYAMSADDRNSVDDTIYTPPH